MVHVYRLQTCQPLTITVHVNPSMQIRQPLRNLIESAAAILDIEEDEILDEFTESDVVAPPSVGEDTAKTRRVRAIRQCRESWISFDLSYLNARRAIYYPSKSSGFEPSPLTAESLLTLNAFVFNLRVIGRALVVENVRSSATRWQERARTSFEACSSWRAALRVTAPWLRFIFCDSSVAAGAPRIDAAKISLAMLIASVIDHVLLQQAAYQVQSECVLYRIFCKEDPHLIGVSLMLSCCRVRASLR